MMFKSGRHRAVEIIAAEMVMVSAKRVNLWECASACSSRCRRIDGTHPALIGEDD